MSEVWEQREDESSKAFHAFAHYRDLRPGERSIECAFASHKANCLQPYQGGTSPVPSQWKKWSSKHAWVDRVTAYDRHCDSLLRAAHERAIKDASERWAGHARFIQERALAAFERRDLTDERIRELRLLIVDGVRMEREAYEFDGTHIGSDDATQRIQAFLDAVTPSQEQVAALFAEHDADLIPNDDEMSEASHSAETGGAESARR